MQPHIVELLNGGDWACAYAEEEGLTAVCRELAPLVEQELEKDLRAIEDLAEHDHMAEASARWSAVARTVRLHLAAHA